MRGWIVMLGLATACGGHSVPKSSAPSPAHNRPTVAAPEQPVDATPLTEAECQSFLEHIAELAYRARTIDAKAPAPFNEADLAAAKSQLLEAELNNCIGGPRADFNCAMAATRLSDIRNCN